MTERVTVIMFRVDNGGGNGAGCFEVGGMGGYSEVHECDSSRDLVREGKAFMKNKAKVASRVGCSDRRVEHFRKLLCKSDKKKLSFRRVESEKVCSHPGRDLL